jgi:antitoxin component HigA of HigAB toxin-antitoxin module
MKQIKTHRDYQLARAVIEKFLAKGFDNLTPEDDEKLEVLSREVHEYEKIHYPMPVKMDNLKR